jgi:hypothetical protein
MVIQYSDIQNSLSLSDKHMHICEKSTSLASRQAMQGRANKFWDKFFKN